jgi:NADH:ubiquinone oxidoreductase subunit E
MVAPPAPLPAHQSGLPPQAVERTSRLVRQHRGHADALIEVLHQVQELYGFLPRPRPRTRWPGSCSSPWPGCMGWPASTTCFRLEAPAAHRCAVCLGTACFVKGGAELAAQLERRLGVRLDDPAGDGSWALEHVSCLGACGQAPVLVVDGQLAPRLPLDDPRALELRFTALGLEARS